MTIELQTQEEMFLSPMESKQHEAQIKCIISDMLLFTKELAVSTDEAYKKLTSLYRQARDWKKSIDVKRKEMTEPLRKQTALINDKAKEFTDALDQVIDLANSKCAGYQKLLEDAKRKEEEKYKLAAAMFEAEEVYLPPLEKIIRGDGAIAVTKIEKRFKVVDVTKVPLKYLKIDEKSIEQDIKLGLSVIPGLEIYEEKVTQLRIR